MPTPPKLHQHGTVLFVSTSVEEGLIFPQNPLIEFLLLNALAKAQSHHPGITICHFFVNTTHVHFIIYVNNPDDVKGFMERFKTESAHSVNRLLGRKKRTIWCEGYDSPTLLTEADVLHWTGYCYKNASKDGLESSIEKYPGLSSWGHFMGGKTEYETVLTARDGFKQLPKKRLKKGQYRDIVKSITKGKSPNGTFRIEPDKWMEAFGVEERREELNRSLEEDVLSFEAERAKEREEKNERVIGAKALTQTIIGTPYTPDRKGKKMLCLSLDKKLRQEYIEQAKALFQQGREVLEEWRRGNLTVRYPLGLYPPSLPKVANLWGSPGDVAAHW